MKYFDPSKIIGIPDRNVSSPLPSLSNKSTWEFVIQQHDADRAGTHFDLRLGPAGGTGYSWAGRRLPGIGEKELFVKQPDHTTSYFDFAGEIRSGYGKGKVSTHTRDRVEVLKSTPGKITFYRYPGSGIEKYTLLNMSGNDWLLINHTTSGEIEKLRPAYQKYKDITKTYSEKPDDIKLPKIDGAHGVLILRKDKHAVLLGKRNSKRSGLPIEYTPKLENLLSFIPKDLGTTVLRGEVHSNAPSRVIGGILNSNVWKSREMQRTFGPLRFTAFDVTKYNGKDTTKLPYQARLDIINELKNKVPVLSITDAPPSPEGHVVWRKDKPHKVKTKMDMDVYVKNVFPSINEERAGGFEYSLTPNGKVVGRVGTGFLHPELKDMLKNPYNYVGRVARVSALEQHPSGALRAPSFFEWHKEKNL